MTALLRLVPMWAWILLAAGAALLIQELRIAHKDSALVAAEAERDTYQGRAESLSATLRLQRSLAADRDELDRQHAEAIANAQSENDRLRADIAAGRRRVSVNATCVRPDSDTGAASAVDDATPRLTPTAERARTDLELAVELQRQQIIGLQGYIKALLARLKQE